jgi:antimicrobial peptide system SdpB family protein
MLLDRIINNFLNQNIDYLSYSLLRSVLAFALLLTIVFNNYDYIYIDSLVKIPIIKSINVIWLKSVSILVLLMTISGYYPKINGVLQFIITFAFFKTCPFIDGGDQLSANITLLLVPLTLFDKNKNHWVNKTDSFNGKLSKPIFLFSTLLICIQVSLVYLHSSIGKLSVTEWKEGTALWYWFTHETFGASYFLLDILKSILRYPFVIYVLNWSVITLEVLIAMMLFVPKKNTLPKVIFILALILHIGIILFHGIFTFSIVMIGCLLFYFQINPLKWKLQ